MGIVVLTILGIGAVLFFGWLIGELNVKRDLNIKGILLLALLLLILFIGVYAGKESIIPHPERPPANPNDWLP